MPEFNLIDCAMHGGKCHVNANEHHVDPARCSCMTFGRGPFYCPIDTHNPILQALYESQKSGARISGPLFTEAK